jgi:hypothetical protein
MQVPDAESGGDERPRASVPRTRTHLKVNEDEREGPLLYSTLSTLSWFGMLCPTPMPHFYLPLGFVFGCPPYIHACLLTLPKSIHAIVP